MIALLRRTPAILGAGFRRILIEIIEFYQSVISPVLPGHCRFHPTCSVYAADAIRIHGAFRGSGLAIRRILRCNPWGPAGDDPVPAANDDSACGCDVTIGKRTKNV